MKLFSRLSRPDEKHIIPDETPIQLDPSKKTIIIDWHSKDADLMGDFAPHINHLIANTSHLFQWRLFAFQEHNKTAEEIKAIREEFIRLLQDETFLFLPCTSAHFLYSFSRNCQEYPAIEDALRTITIQPIPLRASAFANQSILEKPLAGFLQGHERDEACVRIIQALQSKLALHTQLPITSTMQLTETTRTVIPIL